MTAFIINWRHGQRDIEQRSILAAAHGFVVLEALAATDAFQNSRFFILTVRRNQNRNGFSDDFVGPVAEKMLGSFVPTRDFSVEILADNRVARRLNNSG